MTRVSTPPKRQPSFDRGAFRDRLLAFCDKSIAPHVAGYMFIRPSLARRLAQMPDTFVDAIRAQLAELLT